MTMLIPPKVIPAGLIGGLTAGQIVFGSALGSLSQSATLVWTPTTENLLIGTSSDAAASRVRILASKSIVAGAGAIWNGVDFMASTATLTGGVTPVTRMGFVNIAVPTITAAGATTVGAASTVYIAGAPAVGGLVTITEPCALNVASGHVQVAGYIGIGAYPTVDFLVQKTQAGSSVTSHVQNLSTTGLAVSAVSGSVASTSSRVFGATYAASAVFGETITSGSSFTQTAGTGTMAIGSQSAAVVKIGTSDVTRMTFAAATGAISTTIPWAITAVGATAFSIAAVEAGGAADPLSKILSLNSGVAGATEVGCVNRSGGMTIANIGIGTAPIDTGLYPIYIQRSKPAADLGTYAQNPAADGAASHQMVGNTTGLKLTAYGPTFVGAIGGVNYAAGSSILQSTGTGPLIIGTTAAGPIDFFTTGAQRAQITAGGNLLIGSTALTEVLSSKMRIDASYTLPASAAASTWNGVDVKAATYTVTALGVSPITSLALVNVEAPQFTSGAVVVGTTVSTFRVMGAPTVAGTFTATDSYAVDVVSGPAHFGGRTLKKMTVPLASANTLTIGDGDGCHITGVIDCMYVTKTGWTAGSELTLIFDGICTIHHNEGGGAATTAPFFFPAGADVVTAATEIHRFYFDGTYWICLV